MSKATVVVGSRLRHGMFVNGEKVDGYFQPIGQPPPNNSVYGFAFTEIPRAAWEGWLALNAGADVIEKRLMFAADDLQAAQSRAASIAGVIQSIKRRP